MAYCSSCGSQTSLDAQFCSSCGTRMIQQVAINQRPVQPRRAPTSARSGLFALKTIGWFLAVVVVLGAIRGYQLDHSPSQDTPTAVPQPAITPIPTATLPKIPPPKFRLYKFKLNQPLAYIVPVNTTDEQLKSLLWLFREKIREGGFSKIGISQPLSKQWGQYGYQSGMLLVYRGDKCANETYISDEDLAKGNLGPCGYGEHDDAYYQWGLDADPKKDAAALVMNGSPIQVFDYKDNWRASSETIQKVDQKVKDQWNQEYTPRQQFAVAMTNELNKEGIAINASANATNPKQLNFQSTLFKNNSFRQSFFTKGVLPVRTNLCNAGFQSIRMVRESESDVGQTYPLQCSQ